MAPLIEVSEDYLKELDPNKYTRRFNLEGNLEKELQNTESIKGKNTLYFSISDQNGSFNVSNGKQTKEDLCFYKIDFSENSNKGELSFISGEYDKRAIENLDFYICPVCEIQNISDRKYANKVKLIEPGEVYLSGGDWKINPDKRVKVKLNKIK